MLTDHMLNILGDHFVEHKLEKRGWKFYEFVEAWQKGNIVVKTK